MPSALPFVTDCVNFKRYETVSTDAISVTSNRNTKKQVFEIKSDTYNFCYMPNSFISSVTPNTVMMYGSGYHSILSSTYAQITGLEDVYGISQSSCTTTMRETSSLWLCVTDWKTEHTPVILAL